MELCLSTKELATVKAIIQAHAADLTVWVFGSRLTGKATKFSDLDLVLLSQNPLAAERLVELKDAFSASSLPFAVDVIVWTSLDESFKNIIKDNFYVLQG